VRLWTVGTTVIKDELYGDLTLSPPDDVTDGFPAGYIHFPQYDQEYFKQLTAEKKMLIKDKRGFTKSSYIKVYERNEILDLHVYNRALGNILNVDRLTESGWKRLEMQNKLAQKVKTNENGKEEKKNRRRSKRKDASDFWDN